MRYGLIIILLVACASAAAGQPHRFGFGRTPSAKEIRQWDIDIMPDGKQLPPGGGTAQRGKIVYVKKCLSCHGEAGRGGANDQLAGSYDPAINFATDMKAVRTVGSYWPYATTLYDYINRAMPFNAPGSLSTGEVYSLVAYLLSLNGIIAPDDEINADSLPGIVMPARHLFYWSDEVER